MILELFVALGELLILIVGSILEIWISITGFREVEKVMREQQANHPPTLGASASSVSSIEEN